MDLFYYSMNEGYLYACKITIKHY